MKKVYNWVGFLFICLVCFSCASFQQDMLYTTGNTQSNVSKVEELERDIVIQRMEPNIHALSAIQRDLKDLLSLPSSDSVFLARVYALYANSDLLKKDISAARKKISIALKYNSNDEYAHLVQALLISNQDKKKSYLEAALKNNKKAYRLRAELGSVFYSLEKYTDALVSFDASLPFLSEEYKNLFQAERDFSLAHKSLSSGNYVSSKALVSQKKISLLSMTIIAQDNTNALDYITGTAKWKPEVLADRLHNAGWYEFKGPILKKNTTTRKDAALFLWHLMQGPNTSRLNRYSRYYEKKGRSPIPDVSYISPFFDAIVGTVEEDIIPLVDGRNFDPDGDVSGLEFYEWLLRADKNR